MTLALSCTPAPGGNPVEVDPARTPESLAALLESIASRTDAEACAARGRIYAKLRAIEGKGSPILRAKGDAADLDVLTQAAPADLKEESAGRVTRHFLERARSDEAVAPFEGPRGAALRRFVLLTVAANFGEYASRELHAEALEGLAEIAEALSALEDVRPELRKEWHLRARAYSIRAEDLRAADERSEVSPEARKFCESDIARHLEEATRAADRATAEKAGRGDVRRILECYLLSLSHFGVARECLVSPSPAQEHALSGMEIVAQSTLNLLRREP